MWFVIIDGKKEGLYENDKLVGLLKQGRISGENLVWGEGMSEWQLLKNVPELSLFLSSNSPFPPPTILPGSTKKTSSGGIFNLLKKRKVKLAFLMIFIGIVLFATYLGMFTMKTEISSEEASNPDPVKADPKTLASVCPGLNETLLESVVKCFYSPGKPFEPKLKWALLSKRSQSEISLEQWIIVKRTCDYTDANILGEEERSGKSYAKVSVSQSCTPTREPICKKIRTHTWIREGSSWRCLILPKMEELASEKFKNGDYSASQKVSEEWLIADPYSIDAYSRLYYSQQRSPMLPTIKRQKQDAIIRATLSINPNDSSVLKLAASASEDFDISKTFVDKLPRDSCTKAEAVVNVAIKMSNFPTRYKFLKESGQDTPAINMLMLCSLAGIGKREELYSLYTDSIKQKIRIDLDENDSSYAAAWASLIGSSFLQMKDYPAAIEWADYAITRDPNSPEVIDLAKIVARYRTPAK